MARRRRIENRSRARIARGSDSTADARRSVPDGVAVSEPDACGPGRGRSRRTIAMGAFSLPLLWSTLKGLATVAKEAGKLDLYEKALDAQQQLQELAEENRECRARIVVLEAQLAWKGKLRFERGVYWASEDGGRESAFCPR